MNFIGVIACLGLIFGTLFESGAAPADVSPNPGFEDGSTYASVTVPTIVKDKKKEKSQPLATTSIPFKADENKFKSDISPEESKDTPNTLNTETTSENKSVSDVTDLKVKNQSGNGTNDITTTLKPTDGTKTTQAPPPPPPTTEKPPTTIPPVEPTTTNKPTPTEKPTTEKTTTTTVTPAPTPSTTSTVPPTPPPVTSTKAALTTQAPTDKPAEERRFDGPSFIGGIVFALGVTAIAFVAWKFYKARTERNYHTL